MSYYYKYDFVSPEPLYATVKEELKSHISEGKYGKGGTIKKRSKC